MNDEPVNERDPSLAKPARAELRVTRSLAIAEDELEWAFSASGGPGGQHANTANTKVELRFDIERSRSIGPRQRTRLLEKLGPVVRVVVSQERSQHRNRDLARERLAERLRQALVVETPRVATKPTKSAQQRRLDAKVRQGQRKRERQRPHHDE